MRPVGPSDHVDPVDPEDTLIPAHDDDDPNIEPDILGPFRYILGGFLAILVIGVVIYIIGKRI